MACRWINARTCKFKLKSFLDKFMGDKARIMKSPRLLMILMAVVFLTVIYFICGRENDKIPPFSLEAMLTAHIGPIPRASSLMNERSASSKTYIRETISNSTGLYQKVRVLCFVLTMHESLKQKAEHVRRTWGNKCNKLLFFSSKTDDSFPTIGLDTAEGYKQLSGKTLHALKYIFQNHFDDADWFLKADDDTFVILENLRYFLVDKNPNTPVFFGHHFKTVLKNGFASGGAGYVLSKEALGRYGKFGHDPKKCNTSYEAEDVDFAACMDSMGVHIGNSTDKYGRSRFHCFHPEAHVIGQYPSWYEPYDANGAKMGEEFMSDYAISFHYVPPQHMYMLHYFVYHLHPYGIVYNDKKILILLCRMNKRKRWCLLLFAVLGPLCFYWTRNQNDASTIDVFKVRIIQSNEEMEFPTSENDTNTIPHIIHQIFTYDTVPEIYAPNIKEFVSKNPDWEYRFWTFKSGQKLIEKYQPDLLATYMGFGNTVKKADLLRYVIIYLYGGIYSDLDSINLRPLNKVTKKYSCIIPAEPFEHSLLLYKMEFSIQNGIILCRPNHPFIKRLIENTRNVHPNASAVHSVGPLYVTKQFKIYNNISDADTKRTKTDLTSNSPLFYKGQLPEDHPNAIYVPNSQYFMDNLDPGITIRILQTCKTFDKQPYLVKRVCLEFRARQEVRKNRKYTFMFHTWDHSYGDKQKIKYFSMKQVHIETIVPKVSLYQS